MDRQPCMKCEIPDVPNSLLRVCEDCSHAVCVYCDDSETPHCGCVDEAPEKVWCCDAYRTIRACTDTHCHAIFCAKCVIQCDQCEETRCEEHLVRKGHIRCCERHGMPIIMPVDETPQLTRPITDFWRVVRNP